MPRQYQRLEFNSFIKGFVTEAGPLTFPENATLDEQNFVLNKDGSRYRRFGMNLEPGAVELGFPTSSSVDQTVFQTFVWENAGGIPDKSLLAVQMGRYLKFFDLNQDIISDNPLQGFLNVAEEGVKLGFASINGNLIAASNTEDISVYSFDGTSITKSESQLLIRDFFGLEDRVSPFEISGGLEFPDLRDSFRIGYRPFILTDAHLYNLRNQSFGIPRRGTGAIGLDPVLTFQAVAGKYPSNSDTVNSALYPDANNSENRLVERFFPRDLKDNPLGNYHAANGAMIIGAISRGAGRINAILKLSETYPELLSSVDDLNIDKTDGGATVVAEYAGRAFFAGFSDTITEPDKHSPRLGSYVLFSQLVKNPSDVFKCYQEADPTSPVFSDLVATDGGFIKIENAFGIVALRVIDNKLVIFAKNGVWALVGGSEYGFDAVNYKVIKITDRGCLSSNSIANVDNTLLYWAESGIFAIAADEFGTLRSQNITTATIQSFYDDIPVDSKRNVYGVYDSYRRQVRWLFNYNILGDNPIIELVLDVGLGAFYKSNIKRAVGSLPIPVAMFRSPPFKEGLAQEDVTVNGEQVTVNAEDVFVERKVSEPITSEIKYLVVTALSDNSVTISFGFYRDTSFKDWDGFLFSQGVDADAYLITGWETLGDTQRDKVTTYVNFHLNKSETGFEIDGSGDYSPINTSSCLVQAQWDWSNSPNSNRWGKPFQAYRHTRFYIPTDINDKFDNGNKVVTTKNKLRGYGVALSMKISTEPEKDCQLLGWSRLVAVETNV